MKITAKKALIGTGILTALWLAVAGGRKLVDSVNHIRIYIGKPTFKKVSTSGLPVDVPVTIDNKSAVTYSLTQLYCTILGIDSSGNQTEIVISNQFPTVTIGAYQSTPLLFKFNLPWLGALSVLQNKGFDKIRISVSYNMLGQPMVENTDYNAGAILSQLQNIKAFSQLASLFKK